jgi:hypothetical protein
MNCIHAWFLSVICNGKSAQTQEKKFYTRPDLEQRPEEKIRLGEKSDLVACTQKFDLQNMRSTNIARRKSWQSRTKKKITDLMDCYKNSKQII